MGHTVTEGHGCAWPPHGHSKPPWDTNTAPLTGRKSP